MFFLNVFFVANGKAASFFFGGSFGEVLFREKTPERRASRIREKKGEKLNYPKDQLGPPMEGLSLKLYDIAG